MNAAIRLGMIGIVLAGLVWLASSDAALSPVLRAEAEPAKADPADAIKPPDGLVVLAKFKAAGVQIYECKAVDAKSTIRAIRLGTGKLRPPS